MPWPSPQPSLKGRHLVLYDGECGLCDRSVQFLLKRDRDRVLTFATLEGETGRAIRARWQVPASLDSMLFVRDEGADAERVLARSTAALEILQVMGGSWSLLVPFRWVPRPLRDAVYSFVAKRRIRWFGRLETCRVPSPDERARFLD